MFTNDEDIKIATSTRKQNTDNSDQIALAFKLQQENGNIDKAKLLGTLLSNDVNSVFLTKEYTKQLLILVRFCVTNSITIFLENETLAHIAIDEFDSSLSNLTGIKNNDNLSGEMFSLFLIASSERINVAEHIAKAYSQFCTDENKKEYASQAIQTFDSCNKLVKKRIEELNFVNIKSL